MSPKPCIDGGDLQSLRQEIFQEEETTYPECLAEYIQLATLLAPFTQLVQRKSFTRNALFHQIPNPFFHEMSDAS